MSFELGVLYKMIFYLFVDLVELLLLINVYGCMGFYKNEISDVVERLLIVVEDLDLFLLCLCVEENGVEVLDC